METDKAAEFSEFLTSLEHKLTNLEGDEIYHPTFLKKAVQGLRSLNEYVRNMPSKETAIFLSHIENYRKRAADFIISSLVGDDIKKYESKKLKSVRLAFQDFLYQVLK